MQAAVNLSQAETAEDLKHAIARRIQALANVHAVFAQSRWTGAELHNLIEQELSPYRREDETRTRIESPTLLLEPNIAQTMAVILHELATNAAKYVALTVPEGKIRVDWWGTGYAQLILHWTESDGPSVKPLTCQGFGIRIMERLIRQLNGKSRFDWGAEGLTCELTIPL